MSFSALGLLPRREWIGAEVRVAQTAWARRPKSALPLDACKLLSCGISVAAPFRGRTRPRRARIGEARRAVRSGYAHRPNVSTVQRHSDSHWLRNPLTNRRGAGASGPDADFCFGLAFPSGSASRQEPASLRAVGAATDAGRRPVKSRRGFIVYWVHREYTRTIRYIVASFDFRPRGG